MLRMQPDAQEEMELTAGTDRPAETCGRHMKSHGSTTDTVSLVLLYLGNVCVDHSITVPLPMLCTIATTARWQASFLFSNASGDL